MSSPILRIAGRLVVLPCAALSMSACSVLTPIPALEHVKATGTATSVALAYAPGSASNTVHHGAAPVSALCIEYNRTAQLPDLVPAMQLALQEQGVRSRVYEPGAGLNECRHWLRYTASIQWGIPPLASDYRAYLSSANFSLHTASGELIATTSYESEGLFGTSRWAPTHRKLRSAMKAVITGFES